MDLINEIVLPNNWSELVALKDILPFCTNKITRFPEYNQAYQNYKDSMSRQQHLQNIINNIGDQDYKITPNKFPYSRLIQHIPEVQHFLLWSKTGEPLSGIVESEIEKVFPNKDHFWFVNSVINKSIPEIWHCHIFIKMN